MYLDSAKKAELLKSTVRMLLTLVAQRAKSLYSLSVFST